MNRTQSSIEFGVLKFFFCAGVEAKTAYSPGIFSKGPPET